MIVRLIVLLACCVPLFADANLQAQTPDYFAIAEISNSSPYENEQVIFSVRYYAHLPRLATISYPGFSGFWLIESGERSSSRIETVGNRQYNVREFFVTLAPLQAGPLTIDRAQLEIPEDVFNQGYLLLTEPIEIDVLPLPDDSPEEFNGAVGQFHVVKQVDVESITLGQPVHLSITVDGVGNLERLPMPRLPEVDGWRAYANQPRYVVGIIGGLSQKIFEWVLIPERSGTQTYPPIVFSYFDPEAEEYNSIVLEETVIDVFPGDGNVHQLPEFVSNASGRNALLPLKPTTIASIPATSSNFIRLIWLVVPLIAMLMIGLHFLRTTEYRRRLAHQRSRIYRQTIKQIKSLRGQSPQLAGDTLEQMVKKYIAEKTHQDSDENIETLVDNSALEPKHKEEIIRLFEAINDVRYAPAQVEVDASAVVKQAASLVTTLETIWDEQ